MYKIYYTNGKGNWLSLEFNTKNEYDNAIKIFLQMSEKDSNFEFGDKILPGYLKSIEELKEHNLYGIALLRAIEFVSNKYFRDLTRLAEIHYEDNGKYPTEEEMEIIASKVTSLDELVPEDELLNHCFKNTGGFSRRGAYWFPF